MVDLIIESNFWGDVAAESLPKEMTLIWPSGLESRWNRGDLIQALEGNSVYRIQASQSGYFLYVRNVDILWINYLIDRATGYPFLHWNSVE